MTDWGIVTARLLQFGPALVLMGSPLFYLYGFKSGAAEWLPRRWAWPSVIVLSSAALALIGAVLWLLSETAMIFSEPGAFGPDALWTVMSGTGFGRAAFLRVILIAASITAWFSLAPGRLSWIVLAALGAAIVASFAWTGHGVKNDGMPGLLHVSGDVLHLLAAAVWIGALVPLSVLVLKSLRMQDGADARVTYDALERFSAIGPAVVALLVLSGLINTWFLVGPDHVLTMAAATYGRLLVAKLFLFAAMIGLASGNRYRFSPQLGAALQENDGIPTSLHALRCSIIFETGLALLVLFAVSWMGTLEPVQA